MYVVFGGTYAGGEYGIINIIIFFFFFWGGASVPSYLLPPLFPSPLTSSLPLPFPPLPSPPLPSPPLSPTSPHWKRGSGVITGFPWKVLSPVSMTYHMISFIDYYYVQYTITLFHLKYFKTTQCWSLIKLFRILVIGESDVKWGDKRESYKTES